MLRFQAKIFLQTNGFMLSWLIPFETFFCRQISALVYLANKETALVAGVIDAIQ